MGEGWCVWGRRCWWGAPALRLRISPEVGVAGPGFRAAEAAAAPPASPVFAGRFPPGYGRCFFRPGMAVVFWPAPRTVLSAVEGPVVAVFLLRAGPGRRAVDAVINRGNSRACARGLFYPPASPVFLRRCFSARVTARATRPGRRRRRGGRWPASSAGRRRPPPPLPPPPPRLPPRLGPGRPDVAWPAGPRRRGGGGVVRGGEIRFSSNRPAKGPVRFGPVRAGHLAAGGGGTLARAGLRAAPEPRRCRVGGDSDRRRRPAGFVGLVLNRVVGLGWP